MRQRDENASPTMDYETPKPGQHLLIRIGVVCAMISWILFAPTALLAISSLTIDPVNRQWITSLDFNACLRASLYSNLAGLTFGILGIRFTGKTWLALAILCNGIALLLGPTFFLA